MRGISEEFLKGILDDGNDKYKMSAPYINAQRKVIQALINQCKEFNPWLPIDNNTPPNRRLLLFYPGLGIHVGERLSDGNFCIEAYDMDTTPTHYQELPDAPKE